MTEPPVIQVMDDGLYEVVDGQRVEKVMGFYECGIASILTEYLTTYVRAQQLGRVRMETLFLIDPTGRLKRRPDVAFVSYDRWPRDRRLPRGDAAPVIPDLAAEVVSPSNTATEVQRKRLEYFQAGVRLVWVIYPDQFEVFVYTAPTSVRILTRTDDLDGGDVVPGFRLSVAVLFEDEPAPPNDEATAG